MPFDTFPPIVLDEFISKDNYLIERNDGAWYIGYYHVNDYWYGFDVKDRVRSAYLFHNSEMKRCMKLLEVVELISKEN